MNMHNIKLEDFEEVGQARPDNKGRVPLGKIKPSDISSYMIYQNPDGDLLLRPKVEIPAKEAWLFKNHKALKQVRQGLKEADEGKVVKAPEDFSKYIDGDDDQ